MSALLALPAIAPPMLIDTSLINRSRRQINLARSARAILAEHWAGSNVERTMAVFDVLGFGRRWWEKQAMALVDCDLEALARASTLLEAVNRLAPGGLVECRVSIGETSWDVWVDTDRRLPIAARSR